MRLLKLLFIVVPHQSVCIAQWHAGPEGFKSGNVVITVIAIAFRFPGVISRSVRSRESRVRRSRGEKTEERKRESRFILMPKSNQLTRTELEMALQDYQRICTLHRLQPLLYPARSVPGAVRHTLRHNAAREGREQCADVGKHENTRIR